MSIVNSKSNDVFHNHGDGCFTGDSLIMTTNGLIEIKDVTLKH